MIYITGSTGTGNTSSKKEDIRNLATIFGVLIIKEADSVSQHLIRCMKDSRDEWVPPAEAISYHPFFWSDAETNEYQNVIKKLKHSVNNDALQKDLAYAENSVAENESDCVLQTWLMLQKYKDDEEVDDVDSYYHPAYAYPNYEEVILIILF